MRQQSCGRRGCTINITFTPTATGNRTGTLTINDNAAGSPHTVALSGTGTVPIANLSPTSLSFGNQLVGTISAPQPVALSNSGSAPLTINSITASGDFAQTNDCGSSLAAGASCTINVHLHAHCERQPQRDAHHRRQRGR